MKLLVVLTGLTIAWAWPALAAQSCQTPGDPGSSRIDFPKGDGTDVAFVRAMPPSIFDVVAEDVVASARCGRGTFQTRFGEYQLTGENSEVLPRRALPVAEGNGPVAYLLSDHGRAPGEGPYFMLVIQGPDNVAAVRAFFVGIPDDERLIEAIEDALARDEQFMSVDLTRRFVTYEFDPGEPLSALQSQKLPDGTSIKTGPQVFASSLPGEFYDKGPNGEYVHLASGLGCVQDFEQVSVLLARVDAQTDRMECFYRLGEDPTYDRAAELRYALTFIRDPDSSTADALEYYRQSGRPEVSERTSPLAPNRLTPGSKTAFFDDARAGRTAGVWFTRRGEWLVVLQTAYETGPENDAQAAIVADILLNQTWKSASETAP